MNVTKLLKKFYFDVILRNVKSNFIVFFINIDEPERLPLYPGPQNLVKEKTEQAPQETKKTKELKDLQQNVKSLALRQKSKTKIVKEIYHFTKIM